MECQHVQEENIFKTHKYRVTLEKLIVVVQFKILKNSKVKVSK